MGNFGRKLRELRLAKGMTQKELGGKVFESDKTVSLWENGKKFPDSTSINMLCSLLDTTPNELLGYVPVDTMRKTMAVVQAYKEMLKEKGVKIPWTDEDEEKDFIEKIYFLVSA